MNYNFDKKPDNIFFEDAIAKAILFRAAEKIYGVKPNAIGDMRYITVPYSIALLGYKLNYKLDLYKIWKNQAVSDKLKSLLFTVMREVESFIKENAPGSLYGEYAKREDCWNSVKQKNFEFDFSDIKEDLESSSSATKRQRVSDDEIAKVEFETSISRIKSVHYKVWRDIENWGQVDKKLSRYLCDTANTISNRLRSNRELSPIEIGNAHKIIDIIVEEAPELFYKLDEIYDSEDKKPQQESEITLEVIKDIVAWDKKNKRLKDYEYRFMSNLVEGKSPLTQKNIFIAGLNLEKVKKFGFGK